MSIVEYYLSHKYEHSEVKQHSGEGRDVVTTRGSPPRPNAIDRYTKDKVHYNQVEQALPDGLGILLSVHLDRRGEGQ